MVELRETKRKEESERDSVHTGPCSALGSSVVEADAGPLPHCEHEVLAPAMSPPPPHPRLRDTGARPREL